MSATGLSTKPTLRGKRKGGPGRRGEEDTQGLTFTIASRAQKPGAEEEEGKGEVLSGLQPYTKLWQVIGSQEVG